MTKEQLKEYREGLKLTQTQFAQRIGLNREKTISDYERGTLPIPDWLISRIEFEKSVKWSPDEEKDKNN